MSAPRPARRRAAAPPAAEVSVDRLVLHVPGLDQAGARALARLVAHGLAADLVAVGVSGRLETIRVEITADPAEPALLAHRIAAEVGHGLAPGGVNGEPAR